ncbi:MAG: D-amino acid aminotransferase [Mariprofundaceae bacterium]
MSLIAWVNDQFVTLEKATVHIEDRGFQFSDGVYEVVACFGGTFLDLDAHLQRLVRSCDAIELPLPCSLTRLKTLVGEIYQKNPFDDAMIYIQITRGVAPRAHNIPSTVTPTLVMTARQLPKPSDEKLAKGAKVITLADIRWKRCDIKSIALLASVLGKQEAARHSVDEACWLDDDGHLLEGCATNIFAVINGTLVTHPCDAQILGGITRDMLLKIAEEEGIKIEERPWKPTETGLTECMLTSTTNAVLPICVIDNHAVGHGKPGPIALNLRQKMCQNFEMMRQHA